MDKELNKVMATGVLMENLKPHVSADAVGRMSKFAKAMLTERMLSLSRADRKYREEAEEKERARIRVMAPGMASAISALREVQRETKYRNIARQEEAAARARAASEEREAAGVARSRSGSPIREKALPEIPKGKKNAITITDADTLMKVIAAAKLPHPPTRSQLDMLRYNLESGRFSGVKVHMTPVGNLVAEAVVAPGAATGGSAVDPAFRPAIRKAVEEVVADLSPEVKKAFAGIRRNEMYDEF